MGAHLTIGQLARRNGLSRSTLLYYDRLGLLRPTNRSEGNYRLYSAAEADRLEQIRLYRRMGVPLKSIGQLLDQHGPDSPRAARLLRHRLEAMNAEIERLQEQQRELVRLLGAMRERPAIHARGGTSRTVRAPSPGREPSPCFLKEGDMINKERWVAIMKAAGFSDEAMHNWHRQFEKMEPDGHQEFLESLGIEAAETDRIRQWSRS